MSDFWLELARDLRLDLLGYLVVAIFLGAAVGLERELRGKAAGLRTNVLICVGSTLFTWLSIEVAGPYGDPGRIAAQIVTGVGFIGAGTILHSRGHISGLTSAATIWLVAAIGVAVGAGAVLEATGATLLVLLVLGLLRPLEKYLTSYGGVVRVTVEVEPRPEAVTDIERIVREAGLEVMELRSEQRGERLVVHVAMSGPARLHDEAKLRLLRASGALTISVEE
ncbi:MAG: MgtC/SapB family protein [Gemmatimonadota bacterium]|nr:MAG: MgtC/SapB family protein [Gemmatimonadota bacterium]